DRHHLGMTRARHEVGGGQVELLMGVVRVGADRAVDLGEAFRDGEKPVLTAHPRGDGDEAPEPGCPGPGHYGVELVREGGKIEMAVAGDQHCSGFSVTSGNALQRLAIRPVGTGPRTGHNADLHDPGVAGADGWGQAARAGTLLGSRTGPSWPGERVPRCGWPI